MPITPAIVQSLAQAAPGVPAAPAPAAHGIAAGWRPDRDQARRLLREELSGREYAEAAPHPVLEWLGGLWGGFVEWFDSLGGGPAFPGWVLLVIVVVVAVGVLLLVRPGANAAARARRTPGVIGDRSLTPEDHRRAATSALAAGNLDAALASWFRAVVRQAEVRTLLDTRPGRTATEAAHALAAVYPTEHDPLHRAAAVFNAVVYGDRSATAAQAEAVRALDARLQAAAAAPVSPAGGSGAGASTPGVPR